MHSLKIIIVKFTTGEFLPLNLFQINPNRAIFLSETITETDPVQLLSPSAKEHNYPVI